jgi:hypothetical protein
VASPNSFQVAPAAMRSGCGDAPPVLSISRAPSSQMERSSPSASRRRPIAALPERSVGPAVI